MYWKSYGLVFTITASMAFLYMTSLLRYMCDIFVCSSLVGIDKYFG
jgi:hypothetical protein